MTATHATTCRNCPYLAGEHGPDGACPGSAGPKPTHFQAVRPGKVIDLLDHLAPRIVHTGPVARVEPAVVVAALGGEPCAPVAVPPPVEPKPKRTRAQFCTCKHARPMHSDDGLCTIWNYSRKDHAFVRCPCEKFVQRQRAKKNTGQPAADQRSGDGTNAPDVHDRAPVAPHPPTEQPGNGSADSAASTVNDVGAAPPSLSPLSKTPAPDASSVERPESSPARGLPLTDEGVLTFYARKVGHFHGALERLSAAWAPLNHILDVGHEDTGTRERLLRMNEAVRRLTEIAKARTMDEMAKGDGCG